MDLVDKFEEAIESEGAASLEQINTRRCSSDNYAGMEYTFYGGYVPIRPIIDVVADEEGKGIEHLGHVNDHECSLKVFVADYTQKPHPAFV